MAKSPDSGGGDRAHADHVAMIGDALGLAAEQGAPEPHGAQYRRRAQYGEAEAAVVGPRMGREAQRAPPEEAEDRAVLQRRGHALGLTVPGLHDEAGSTAQVVLGDGRRRHRGEEATPERALERRLGVDPLHDSGVDADPRAEQEASLGLAVAADVPEIDASGRQLAVEQAPRGRANVVGVAEGPGEDAGRASRERYKREIGAGQGLGHLVDGSVTPTVISSSASPSARAWAASSRAPPFSCVAQVSTLRPSASSESRRCWTDASTLEAWGLTTS